MVNGAGDIKLSFYVDKFGVFHKILSGGPQSGEVPTIVAKASSTWLRLILLFWNQRVMKVAFRFSFAAWVMHRFEGIGFLLLMLLFTI